METNRSKMDTVRHIKTATGVSLPVVRTRLNSYMELFSEKQLMTAKDTVEFMAEYMCDLAKETAVLVCLDCSMRPICVSLISEGTPTTVSIPAREIVQIGLLANASYLIVMHNHPDCYKTVNNLKPSKEDVLVTEGIQRACSLMGMTLLDSIVVGQSYHDKKTVPAYYSMRDKQYNKLMNPQKHLDKEKEGLWLGCGEQYMVWDDKEVFKKYWGFETDREELKSITAYSDEELKVAIRAMSEKIAGTVPILKEVNSMADTKEAMLEELKRRHSQIMEKYRTNPDGAENKEQ